MGLGNPGNKYRYTRHNVGFMVIDKTAALYGIKLKVKGISESGTGLIEGQEVILIKPLTYMNLSGNAVRDIVKYNLDSTIVIQDDIDMETGKLKIKRNGSSGGHKGVQSIIDSTGQRDFLRVKVGVGRDFSTPVEDYVLSGFRRSEAEVIEEAIHRAVEALACILTNGVDSCMNKFN